MRICEYCGAHLDPGERCDCINSAAAVQAIPEDTEIALRCIAPPVIAENLAAVTAYVDHSLAQLAALERTKDGCAAAKALRADLRRRFEAMEDQRKAVKTAVMAPYNAAEKAYKEKIAAPITAADQKFKDWIDSYQDEVKRNCKEELQSYFDELCAVLHIDFVTFDQTGVVVDMATANLKDPKKARNAIHDFLNRVEEDRRTISTMEYAGEILAEYKLSLSLSAAIAAVTDRQKRIAEAAEQISANAPQPIKPTAVSVLQPPTVQQTADPVLTCRFTVKATRSQLKKIKDFLIKEEIPYE